MIFRAKPEQDWTPFVSERSVAISEMRAIQTGANALSLVRIKQDTNYTDKEIDRLSTNLAAIMQEYDLAPEDMMAALILAEPTLNQPWQHQLLDHNDD